MTGNQLDALESVIEYLEELKEKDLGNTYILFHHQEKAHEIIKEYFGDMEPKLKRKKMTQLVTAFEKIANAIHIE